ncbi:MAG: hypothetical protein ACQGVK_14990 [Myxococcota bacterium]
MRRSPARSPALVAVIALALVGLALGGLALGGWVATGWMDGPWGMLPGGRLRGPGEPCEPAALLALGRVERVELEVRPARPRSITTWSLVHEGAFYVPADFLTPWKRWPHQALEDPRVRLRAAGRIFECRAERVRDAALVARLRAGIARKYDLQPDSRAARIEVWWFRLGPRTAAAREAN